MMETVMEDLHEATRLYMNHPDPVEAAARKQRVLTGDANGDTEEAARRIISASPIQQSPPTRLRLEDSNPNTPPPLPVNPLQVPVPQDPSPLLRNRDVDVMGHAIYRDLLLSDISWQNHQVTPEKVGSNEWKLRSIIVSPLPEREESPRTHQNPAEKEETLREFKNKVRGKPLQGAKNRTPRSIPNILRGASSKKRNISQIRNSPKTKSRGSDDHNGKTSKRQRNHTDNAGPSDSTNPPIQRIPALNRKKLDFQAPQPRVP